MAVETLAQADASKLKGKSILVTGGASGLGLHAAKYLVHSGAIITIADAQDGSKVVAEMTEEGLTAQYVYCNVIGWKSQVKAFEAALNFSPTKTLDTVAMYAGVDESGHLVDYINASKASLGGPAPPPPIVKPIEVNTIGVFYTATLALHYFRLKSQGTTAVSTASKSLTIVSSLAGYIDDTHDSVYTASKFGSRGIFCAIRGRAQAELNVRVNLVAPWAMKTPMTAPVLEQMSKFGIEEVERDHVRGVRCVDAGCGEDGC